MTDWNGINQKKEELLAALPSSIVDKYDGKIGIYKITIEGKLAYVGKSTNCLRRWIAHKINTLYNFHQHDYYEEKYAIFRDAYKRNYSISCDIIEECEEEELATRERYWIEKLNPPLNGGRATIGWKGWELLDSIENPQ